MKESVYSICGMCTVRCPIKVDVEDGVVKWIEGNPNDPGMAGRLCAKGSAGLAMLYDYERPQHPMIREGKRGEGKWKKAGWDEALDYITDKLKKIKTLLVDDDEFIRDSLKIAFKAKGCALQVAESAEEGLEAVREESFDIIISDFRLPCMNGLEFLKLAAITQ